VVSAVAGAVITVAPGFCGALGLAAEAEDALGNTAGFAPVVGLFNVVFGFAVFGAIVTVRPVAVGKFGGGLIIRVVG
jgi:hypothetical protein